MSFSIIIDKKMVVVNNNMTILQACESANIIVPKFCYHERLSIAGNCRMCLVEIDKAPKLVASCAMPVIQNMVVHTNSLAVKKAREGVLEFLLINHPLDCGICDQAGECDLQEQSKGFGSDRGRFQENKRAVQDFECGPLIKTIMTRCIHCTRCVRFANEIIGLPDLGTSGRGGSLEINLYIKKLFKSEFSGNLIDLCPVGALTSKPYTFTARSWELKSIESIDVLDGIGSNIRLDTRGYELMRILPRLNENINEEWISDKTRFAFDGLRQQRLYEPLLKNFEKKFEIITWKQAINLVVENLNKISFPYTFGAIIGPQADFDSISLLNFLVKKYNGSFINFDNVNLQNVDFKYSYLFNANFKNLEKADICLLLGVNPRIEGAILNLRLRKRYLAGNFKVASFGSFFDTSFPVYNLGSSCFKLLKFFEGKHLFSKYFSQAKTPVIIIGQNFFESLGEKQVQMIIKILTKNTCLVKKNWCGVNILNNKASDTGKYEIGIKSFFPKNLDFKFLYTIGESKLQKMDSSTFVVYQGYQANNTAQFANLILPGKAFTEKISTFVNTEGRYQLTKIATSSPTNSKADWGILYAILDKANLTSFIKMYNTDFNSKIKLLDTTTLIQKVEMDPFDKLNINQQSVIVELDLNNYKLSLAAFKVFKELNPDFSWLDFLDAQWLKAFSKLNVNYPEIYDLYINFIELIHDLIIYANESYFYGLLLLNNLQRNIFSYKLEKNTNIFDLFETNLDTLEGLVNRKKNMVFEKKILPQMVTNSLTDHVVEIRHISNLFHGILIQVLLNNHSKFLNEDLFEEFKRFLEDLKEDFSPVVKKFFNFLPEFLKQLYINLNKNYIFEFYYSAFNFFKSYFLSNNFSNRYKKLMFLYKAYKSNRFYSADYTKTYFYDEDYFAQLGLLGRYDVDVLYEDIDDNFDIIECLVLLLNIGRLLDESNRPKLNLDYFFHEDPDLWIKLINSKSSFSTNDINSLFISYNNHNGLTPQYFSLKKFYFTKELQTTLLIQNNILVSSKVDNFYLMEDFSKFSVLMKHCSDVFLERSPFKK